MDIDKMTGKKLGMAVALEVMGWTEQKRCHNYDRQESYPSFYVGADRLLVFRSPDYPGSDWWAPWRDKKDMWEVIEQLLSQGWEVVVAGGFDGNLAACMIFRGGAASYRPKDMFLHLETIEWASNYHPSECGLVVREQAQKVEEAVLRAALKVVREG